MSIPPPVFPHRDPVLLQQCLNSNGALRIGGPTLNLGIIKTEMLQSCFGESAAHYPSENRWAYHAVPYILKLDANDNGQALSVPEM